MYIMLRIYKAWKSVENPVKILSLEEFESK